MFDSISFNEDYKEENTLFTVIGMTRSLDSIKGIKEAESWFKTWAEVWPGIFRVDYIGHDSFLATVQNVKESFLEFLKDRYQELGCEIVIKRYR